MINGHIDLELILFTLGQYALVLFVGFLAFYGLFHIIIDMRDRRAASLDNTIEVWEKKKKLYQVKHEYYELKKELKPNLFDSLSEALFEEKEPKYKLEEPIDISDPKNMVNIPDDKSDLNNVNFGTILDPITESISENLPKYFPDTNIEEDTKEVEILSLDEELAKDPDFLSHSDVPDDTKIISNENNGFLKDEKIHYILESHGAPFNPSGIEEKVKPKSKKSNFLSSLFDKIIDSIFTKEKTYG